MVVHNPSIWDLKAELGGQGYTQWIKGQTVPKNKSQFNLTVIYCDVKASIGYY